MVPLFLVSVLCRIIVVKRGDSLIHVTPLPFGTCSYCCPIDADKDIEYILFTRRNPTCGTVLNISDPHALQGSNFVKGYPTVIFIHGYSDSAHGKSSTTIRDAFAHTLFPLSLKSTWSIPSFSMGYNLYLESILLDAQTFNDTPNRRVSCRHGDRLFVKIDGTRLNAYLKRGEYNIILVNWAKFSSLPWYGTAVGNTRIVGPQLSRLVNWMKAQGAISLSGLHVIGFSLGAEIAGFMGKALAPQKIGRITGLDAAYPLYTNTGKEGHLTASDAMFVDVIHTDGGNFGFPNPLGHVDFYPNGGKPLQPGCNLGSVFHRSVSRLANQYITCGHNRAWMLFAESVVNPFGFPASCCQKWRPEIRADCTWTPDVLMGFAANANVRGKFYLRTNGEPPFARNLTGYAWK